MRLFTAIELPKELDEQISKLKEKLKTEHAGMTITKDNHFTLKFLGDVEDSKAEQIKEALRKVEFSSYKTKLNNIGVFPNENYVRVIWIGLEPEEETIALKKKIDDMLKDFKFKDDYDFHPHLTLARVKFVKDKEKFKELLKSLKVEGPEFDIKDFKLIRSELKPEGPEYTDLAVYKL
jgi:RNA 2',3'-cyclic 3'-phosphodiesterase